MDSRRAVLQNGEVFSAVCIVSVNIRAGLDWHRSLGCCQVSHEITQYGQTLSSSSHTFLYSLINHEFATGEYRHSLESFRSHHSFFF